MALTQPFLIALAKGIEHSPALLIDAHHTVHHANSLARALLGENLSHTSTALLTEIVDFFASSASSQWPSTIHLNDTLYTVNRYATDLFDTLSVMLLVLSPLAGAPKPHAAVNLFRDIINNIPQYIFLKDRQLRFITCNNEFAKLVGLPSPQEISGLSDFDLPWSYEQAKTYREDDLTILQNGEPKLYYEEKQRDPLGKERTVLISKIPLFDTPSSNTVTGLAGIYHDITDVKELEQELISSKLHAEAANIAKSEFIANISHDIRTPITGMLGLAHHLKENTDSAECYHYAETLIASTQELLSLLNEVIDIIELEPSEPGKHAELFSPRSLAQHNMTLLAPAACHKGLQFTHRVMPNVPLRLFGHRTYLDRILLNILSNAVKFTSRGQVELVIDAIALTPDKLELEITVTDTGIGIPSDRLANIFDQYVRRAPTYQHIFKGSGLGLYVVKRYLDTIGGTIQVESQVGQGSRFTIRLPLSVNAPQERSTVCKRAYVVEDSPIAGFITQQLLQALGFHTTLIAAPDKLPTPLPTGSIWVVSSKHTDVVAALSTQDPSSHSQTLIVTSQHPLNTQQQRHYQALGVAATLQKPLNLAGLREVIA